MNPMLREYLAGEFELAVSGLRDNTKPPPERLYSMSAAFGAILRVMNIKYSRDLVFAHFVVQGAHQQINSVFSRPTRGVFRVDVGLLDVLADALEDVGHLLAAEESIDSVLAEIAEIGFLFTGNGNYLYTKGLPKVRQVR